MIENSKCKRVYLSQFLLSVCWLLPTCPHLQMAGLASRLAVDKQETEGWQRAKETWSHKHNSVRQPLFWGKLPSEPIAGKHGSRLGLPPDPRLQLVQWWGGSPEAGDLFSLSSKSLLFCLPHSGLHYPHIHYHSWPWLTHHLVVGFFKKCFGKDWDNKDVDDEGNKECNAGFNEKVLISFSNFLLIGSVYLSGLER